MSALSTSKPTQGRHGRPEDEQALEIPSSRVPVPDENDEDAVTTELTLRVGARGEDLRAAAHRLEQEMGGTTVVGDPRLDTIAEQLRDDERVVDLVEVLVELDASTAKPTRSALAPRGTVGTGFAACVTGGLGDRILVGWQRGTLRTRSGGMIIPTSQVQRVDDLVVAHKGRSAGGLDVTSSLALVVRDGAGSAVTRFSMLFSAAAPAAVSTRHREAVRAHLSRG